MSVFRRFAPRLQEAIATRLGWAALRPVQEQAGEALLDGANAVVLAPTAGGKTEASMFPVLSGLVSAPPEGLAALYIAPIKALLNNQAERLGLYTEMLGLSRFVWHGDTTSGQRKRFLRAPANVLMTTPESLEVMLVSRTVAADELFADLRAVVIDEIHALAGTDRGAHLLSVLERIARLSRHDVQRVGLSATVGNPEEISHWIQGTSKRASVVVDPPRAPARRELLVLAPESLGHMAMAASAMARGKKSLMFCQSRAVTEEVAGRMAARGTRVFVHHSAVSKEKRAEAEEQYHRGGDACIVCTSTLELGIDVGDLDRVLQVDAPTTVSAFLQRMGRTGRRPGTAANTTFFCGDTETVLLAAALIEKARAGWVESVAVSNRCWPTLVHQLFTMALAGPGVAPGDAWRHLSALPDFSGITHAEFQRLVAWMVSRYALAYVGGDLVVGRAAERAFGRRNFMEMYAVFSSPQSYLVMTMAGEPVGTLEQDFVDRILDQKSSFLLGGRAWAVMRVDHAKRQVRVEPTGSGVRPKWTGYLPHFLSRELCEQMQDLLASDRMPKWLHESAADLLAFERDTLTGRGVLGADWPVIEEEPEEQGSGDGFLWWTWAGGKINNTLRYALRACRPEWQVAPSNLNLRVTGPSTASELASLIETFRDPAFWSNPSLWSEIAEDLPNYRLSKFQRFMPEWVSREMVASYLLDIQGAWEVLGGDAEDLDADPTAKLARVPESETRRRVSERPRQERRWLRPTNPVEWVTTTDALAEVAAQLNESGRIGLDVETTLADHVLCLIQLATSTRTYLVDPLALDDLTPLADVLANADVEKLAHNASFERSVLSTQGLPLEGVVDTLQLSRDKHGRQVVGGHSLAAVCRRELGEWLNKNEQTSNWRQRPLRPSQVEYAALDAEVLLRLADALGRPRPSGHE